MKQEKGEIKITSKQTLWIFLVVLLLPFRAGLLEYLVTDVALEKRSHALSLELAEPGIRVAVHIHVKYLLVVH